jgi:ParB/RepB/Spo0J family partition protein
MQSIEVELQLCYESPATRPIKKEAVEALSESIRECGLLQPITVRMVEKSRAGQMVSAYEVIAGMHRVKACRWLGWSTIPANVIEADDLHAELMLIDENLVRNDLSPAERSAAQARRKSIYEELHPETKNHAAGHGRTKADLVGQAGQAIPAPRYDEAAAVATGQSDRSVRRDVHRGEALGEAALAKVARTSLDKGEELDALAKCAPEKQRELIDRAAAGEKVSAKVELKKEARADREKTLGRKQQALPTRKFGVIVADPEWRFEPWSRETGMDRAADNHYPTSITSVIAERDVASIAADDCVLFLWATGPMIREALAVMEAWGFEYKSQVIWRKPSPITGYWFRSVHELLLVGTRGHIPAPAMGTQSASVIDAPSPGAHSSKPECFLEMIERYFPTLPKIELNRRGAARRGWEAWGNEASPVEPITAEVESAEAKAKAPAESVRQTMPPPTPSSELDIPASLRRGHPDCVVPSGGPIIPGP